MSRIIAIANQKGGVGKTTSTIGIGAALAKENKKVLLIDYDPQGNLTRALGNDEPDLIKHTISDLIKQEILDQPVQIKECLMKHEEGMDYIPSNINLAGMEMNLFQAISREKVLSRILKDVRKEYDYILIDCMPSLGILSVNALTASTDVIIPVQAEFLPTDGLKQLLRSINSVKKALNPKLNIEGVLITMTDKRTNLSKTIESKLREEFGNRIPIYPATIPRAVKVAESNVYGQSIIQYDPNNNASIAYTEIAKEVMKHGEKQTSRENKHRISR